MKSFPAFQLDAVLHKDLASASKVFSLQQIEYYLFIRIPASIAKVCSLYQVDEIVDKAEFVCHRDLWDHDSGRIWYRFKSHMLNQNPGLHVYRMSFVNTCTNDTMQLYFSYVVQTNDPKKPYNYMNPDRIGVCGSCAKN